MASTPLPPAEPNQLASRYPGFTSFKASSSIHYRQRWLRDALIQASLDPRTVELAPSSTRPTAYPDGVEFAFRRRTSQGFGLVLVSQVDLNVGSMVTDGRVSFVTRKQLVREPLLTASRTIWGQKRLTVDGAERYRAIEVVERGGAAAMREVVAALRSTSVDPVHQVCSLIANSYLNIDIQQAIGPGSILTLGPATAELRSDDLWLTSDPPS